MNNATQMIPMGSELIEIGSASEGYAAIDHLFGERLLTQLEARKAEAAVEAAFGE